ncbi:MAG: oligosaccharide flippase family protein [Deltaproteobacteria bacterium]|nr:oligosaccharide flippase family protein [Deltaproteobacteria bacterium]
MSEGGSEARAAGRGVVLITGAKLYFMVAGYVVQFALPRLLGSAVLFGAYSTVVAAASILNNVLVTGTIQSVSRFSAERDERAPSVLRSAIIYQAALAAIVGAGFFGLSGWVATEFLRKASLAPTLRLCTVVVVAYAIYATLIGSLNGRKRFASQALFDISFSTLRTGLTLGLAAVGLGVMGAIGGFAGAATLILAAGLLVVGIGRRGEGVSLAKYAAFAAPLFAYHLLLNGAMTIDLVLLSRYTSIAAEAAGHGADAAEQMANAQAGYYKAAQAFALIPYQAILSVAFVLFPLVSRATFDKDIEATRKYVANALRFSLILVVGGAAVFASRPAEVIGLVFPPAYRVAAPALTVLSGGFVAFSVFVVSSTILNGAGKTWSAMAAVAVTLAGVVGSNLLLVPGKLGVAGLSATATATTIGMVLGCVVAAALVWRVFRALVRPVTLARVAVAAGVALGVGRLAPDMGKLATLAAAVGVLLLYVVTLVVLGELGREDLRVLSRIARRR